MASFKLFGGTDPRAKAAPDAVVVIGLGRFGSALALELMDNDTDVLGIDASEAIVRDLNGHLTHVVRADSTSEATLRELGVHEFERAVVAIGSNLEASILTTSLLLRFGVKEIWAKAVTSAHGAILDQLGVSHVIYPEADMGRRVAHLVRGRLQDFIEIGDGFALVRTTARPEHQGVPLGETDLRSRHGLTVVAVRNQREPWHHATAETVLDADDTIFITGRVRQAEAYGQRD